MIELNLENKSIDSQHLPKDKLLQREDMFDQIRLKPVLLGVNHSINLPAKARVLKTT